MIKNCLRRFVNNHINVMLKWEYLFFIQNSLLNKNEDDRPWLQKILNNNQIHKFHHVNTNEIVIQVKIKINVSKIIIIISKNKNLDLI